MARNPKAQVKIMEMAEMPSHIGSKKACGMWIAVDRYRNQFISCVLASRVGLTGKKLGNTISNVAQGLVMTDCLILPLFRLGVTFRSLKRKP